MNTHALNNRLRRLELAAPGDESFTELLRQAEQRRREGHTFDKHAHEADCMAALSEPDEKPGTLKATFQRIRRNCANRMQRGH